MGTALVCVCAVLLVTAASGGVAKLTITCPSFQDGKLIPTKYANTGVPGGMNVSLPLSWAGVPEAARSLALSVVDIHPIANNWIHWLVLDIPKDSSGLAEGVSSRRMPPGSKELYNSFGDLGYGGPQPPRGSGPHSYVVTVYALSVGKLDLTANSSLGAFQRAIEGKVIASANITGVFER